MEKSSSADILKLLQNTALINTVTPYYTKQIADRKIEGVLVIEIDDIKESVTFSNCHFDEVFIKNTTMQDRLEFTHCTFQKEFIIFNIEGTGLVFNNCLFDQGMSINYCELKYFTLSKVESQNGIKFEGGSMQILDIKPLNEKTQFSLVGKFLLIDTMSVDCSSGITIFAKKAVINNISLSGYYNVASRLDFNNIINKKIELNDLNNDGKFYFSKLRPVGVKKFLNLALDKYIKAYKEFENVNPNELRIVNALSNRINTLDLYRGYHPVLRFREFIEQHFYTDFLDYYDDLSTEFTIDNSSAGILELKNIMFERYTLKIINSDISAVKLINSQIQDIKANDNFLNYYNVYNDLYTSASKQNNTKDKSEYYRISQHYLYKYLKYESISHDRHRGSRFSIIVSKFYSSHGSNWPKACLVTILLAFFFFCFFTVSLSKINLNLSVAGTADFFSNYLPYFPQFINPLHRIDFMQDIAALGPWSALFDFFSRILVSIGIFEIVRSFRKHVRQ
ncbi:MAG: hypothetical protein ACN6OI_11405 [Flavobacterium sp.]|uniref:hypothetical protein n=1 Tax=Flavobacterium sp. TaxID=239 RepID=UPI003D0F24C4